MNAEDFLTKATDPSAWFTKSAALRRSADSLWETFFGATLRWASNYKVNPIAAAPSWEEAVQYLDSAKLLYGIAIETAFKGHILDVRPSDIELKMTADGSGAVQSVEVKHFGVALGKGHDLELLAEKAGVFDRTVAPIFAAESDYRAVREILKHLTEVVYWAGRYPVPLRSGEGHIIPPDVPAKVFGQYIRDWVDPILDRYQRHFWKPPVAGSAERLLDMIERYERTKPQPPDSEQA